MFVAISWIKLIVSGESFGFGAGGEARLGHREDLPGGSGIFPEIANPAVVVAGVKDLEVDMNEPPPEEGTRKPEPLGPFGKRCHAEPPRCPEHGCEPNVWRSGVSGERRKFLAERMAALCRDAAKVQGAGGSAGKAVTRGPAN